MEAREPKTMLANNVEYDLSILNVEGLHGDTLKINNFYFTHFYPHVAKQGDIIINEKMGDPTPAIGLPEAEYVELFNRTAFAIHLSGFTLNDVLISKQIIYPESYLV